MYAAAKRIGSYLLAGAVGLTGCSPNVQQDMNRAARGEVAANTQTLGTPDQIRQEAALAGSFISVVAEKTPAYASQAGMVGAGLESIAASRTDDEFVAAILNMCDEGREAAANEVGNWLLEQMAIARQTGRDRTPKGARAVAYFESLGRTLIDIKPRCDQVRAHLEVAAEQEREAVQHHQQNVDRAIDIAETIFVGLVVVGAAAASGYAQGVSSRPIVIEQPAPAYVAQPETIPTVNASAFTPVQPHFEPNPPITVPAANLP